MAAGCGERQLPARDFQASGKTNPREKAFCDQHIIDRNVTQAAIRAGYSKRSASVTSWRLLRKAAVASRIAELEQEIADRAGLTGVLVREEIRRIASFNVRALFDAEGSPIPLHQLPDEVAACISSVEDETKMEADADGKPQPVRVTKLRFWNKTAALDTAARITGLLKDPKFTIDVNPLTELLERIGKNGSGLPYNAGRSGSGSGPSHSAARDYAGSKGNGLQPRP
jgi:phage terminase small subunit